MNERMPAEIDIAYSDEPDVDFARGMIPHHTSATGWRRSCSSMARTLRCARWRSIIADQEREIAVLRDWLAARGP